MLSSGLRVVSQGFRVHGWKVSPYELGGLYGGLLWGILRGSIWGTILGTTMGDVKGHLGD